jgi:cytochrome c oxidase cbb3-type subunit III
MSLRQTVIDGCLVGALLLSLVACDAMPGRPRLTDHPAPPSEMTTSAGLYGQRCAGCHGADGRFGPARPLNDPLYLALIPRERLRKIIAQGVPNTAMPAFVDSAGGALTEAQIEVLIDNMLTRWGQPSTLQALALPPYDEAEAVANGLSPGDTERGGKVYAEACARCHGADGSGGRNGGSVVDAAYLALVSDQALRTAVIAGRTDMAMPDWRGDVPGQPLTAQQIADVVAWVASHRVPVVGRSEASVEVRRSQP